MLGASQFGALSLGVVSGSTTLVVLAFGVLASQAPGPSPKADAGASNSAEAGGLALPEPMLAEDGRGGLDGRPVADAEPAARGPDPRGRGEAAVTVPEVGDGTFRVVPGPVRTRTYGEITYRLEIETGLPIPRRQFARLVTATLADRRGWAANGTRSFAQSSGPADLRIALASPDTTDRLCAPLETRGRVSCRNGSDVVINAWRWVHGAATYGKRLTAYRRYVVNHEVGHALGHAHAACAAPDRRAPVMLQQTLALQGCRPNPWPAVVDLMGSAP